jgi:hypothetical protein
MLAAIAAVDGEVLDSAADQEPADEQTRSSISHAAQR